MMTPQSTPLPPQSNSPGNSPNPTPTPQHFTELPTTTDTELVQPDRSCNVAPDHVDNLEEIQPLPDIMEVQLQQMIKDFDDLKNELDTTTTTLPNCLTTNNADNQLAINTLPNCVTNHENQKTTHSVEKETPANGKLEFLIKWLGFSNHHNTWKPEHYLSPALVQEYFQQSKLEHSTPTNAVCMTKILTKEPLVTWRCYILRPLILLCLVGLWSSLAKAQPTSIPALHLGPFYDCSQPRHLGISGFPSL